MTRAPASSRRVSRALLVLVTAALLAPIAVAAAEPDAATLEAHRHYQAGEQLYEAADYAAAVAEYLAAYRIKPHPDVLYDIALTYERIYKPRLAREYYEQFVRAAPESPLRKRVESRLKVLRTLPGTLFVDANRPAAAVRLVGPGGVRDARTPHRFDDLAPGSYHVHVELPFHVPVDTTVELEPGAQAVVSAPLEHEYGTLTIYSRPDNARVFLDDKEEGRTTFSRPIEAGLRRRLRVEAEDFPPHEEVIDVLPGRAIEKQLRFHRPLNSGRTELVLAGMAYGGFAGVGLAEAVGAGSYLPVLLAATTGGVGLGFLATWLTTDDYVKVGHSSMIIGATAWGSVLGAGVGLGLELSARNVWATTLLGGGLGLASGLLVARWDDTSSGDAAVVNSGGGWGALTGVLLTEAIGFDRNHDRALGWLSVGGCAVGVAAGALAAHYVEVNRGHVGVIDAGGLTALALAFAIGYFSNGDVTLRDDNPLRLQSAARFGLGGTALGLVAAAVLSRHYKDDLPPTQTLVRAGGARIELGLGGVAVGAGPAGDARALVTLARGTF